MSGKVQLINRTLSVKIRDMLYGRGVTLSPVCRSLKIFPAFISPMKVEGRSECISGFGRIHCAKFSILQGPLYFLLPFHNCIRCVE